MSEHAIHSRLPQRQLITKMPCVILLIRPLIAGAVGVTFKYGGEFDCLMISLLEYFSLELSGTPWSATILVWNR